MSGYEQINLLNQCKTRFCICTVTKSKKNYICKINFKTVNFEHVFKKTFEYNFYRE